MPKFATTTMIQAPADRIWAILTDASNYPTWNSTVTKITGQIAAGQKVTVYTRLSPGRAFPVTVSAFEPPHIMVWTGTMPFGLFTGTRTFTLTPIPDAAVVFAMQEQYQGMLAFLITRLMPDLQPAFDRFAADLKQQAEVAA